MQRHLRVRRAQRDQPPSTQRGRQGLGGQRRTPRRIFVVVAVAPRSRRLLRGHARGPPQPRHRARRGAMPRVEHLLSGSADRTVRLWDVADGRCVKILRRAAVDVTALATSQRVEDLAVSGDGSGKLLCSGGSGGGAQRAPRRALERLDASPVLCLAMSPHRVQGRGGDVVRASERRPGRVRAVRRRRRRCAEPRPRGSGDAQACAWMPSFDESDDPTSRGPSERTRSAWSKPRPAAAAAAW